MSLKSYYYYILLDSRRYNTTTILLGQTPWQQQRISAADATGEGRGTATTYTKMDLGGREGVVLWLGGISAVLLLVGAMMDTMVIRFVSRQGKLTLLI